MSRLFTSGGQSIGTSASASNEYFGLISFRMDWLDLLAVQGTLKSLLQHHSLKAPILQRSAFFMVQLSHSYMTIGKTTALTRQTFEDTLSKRDTFPSPQEITLLIRTISRQSEWLLSKSLQAINAGEGVEKREPSYTVGNAN